MLCALLKEGVFTNSLIIKEREGGEGVGARAGEQQLTVKHSGVLTNSRSLVGLG